MKVLVVEDDKATRNFLKSTLESELFTVDTADDGQKGSYIARTNDYDLIILDNIMPKKTGLEVCKEIRSQGKHTPIIMLSVRADIDEKTSLLDSGADDYLTKPYSHRELLSRIKALLRRGQQISPKILSANGIVLNSETQEVRLNNKEIYLTKKEFSLLELLLKNRGKVISRGVIMEHVWDMDTDPFSKTIETHIVNLRKKIEKKNKKIILNIPGRGYKIKFD